MLKDEAIGILPPETIAGAYISQASWSPSGQYIAFIRKDNFLSEVAKFFADKQPAESMDGSIGIWDSRTRKTTWVWTSKEENVRSISWLAGSDVIIAQITKTGERKVAEGNTESIESVPVSTFIQINAKTKKAVKLLEADEDYYLVLESAPDAPIAALREGHCKSTDTASYFWLITTDPVAKQTYLPEGSGDYLICWMDDGKTPCFLVYKNNKGKEFTDGERKWYSFDPSTKTFNELPGKDGPKAYQRPKPSPSPLVSVPVDTPKELAGPKLNTLWLEQNDPDGKKCRALVAADSDLYLLSPSKNEILYRAEGALFVRRIAIYPRKSIDSVLEMAQRAKLTTQAKEAGLAFLVYANDHEAMLPASDGFREKVYDYCRNKTTLDGFNYCLNGGKQGDMEEPADVMLGYIPGPGGFAVVYVDGHAKWVEQLPEQK